MYFYSAQYKTSRRALDGSGNEFSYECILGYFTSFEEGMQYLQDFYKASDTYIEYIDKVITTKDIATYQVKALHVSSSKTNLLMGKKSSNTML